MDILTYNWFPHSSQRQKPLKQIYNINTVREILVFFKLAGCQLSQLYSNWLELQTHFNIAKNTEKCYNAHVLFDMFNEDNEDINYAYFC